MVDASMGCAGKACRGAKGVGWVAQGHGPNARLAAGCCGRRAGEAPTCVKQIAACSCLEQAGRRGARAHSRQGPAAGKSLGYLVPMYLVFYDSEIYFF